jgi:hypothetical protein
VADGYFDQVMVNRQRLLWAVATRRQLERWEPLVASTVRVDPVVPECVTVWCAEMEHHYTLIAARNLIRAIELPPPMAVAVDETLRAELIEGRDLHEHWVENMPIFNVTPRRGQPKYPSGKAFAKRHPEHGAVLVARLEQQDRRSPDAERPRSGVARATRCRRSRGPQ